MFMPDFTEVQSYGWLYNVVACVGAVAIPSLIWRFARKKVYVLFAAPFILLLAYFMLARLETSIDATGVHYRMYPAQLTQRNIGWGEIRAVEVKNHMLYNGRTMTSFDIYSVDDAHGIYIYLRNGKKIILGTKKPLEARAVLSYRPE
jgi:hypothetical protein